MNYVTATNSKFNARATRARLCAALSIQLHEYEPLLAKLYQEGRSALEIVEYLEYETGIRVHQSGIIATIKKLGLSRTLKQSFRNAAARGRFTVNE